MFGHHSLRTVLLSSVAATVLAPAVCDAQGFPDRDAQEISSYVLTESGLAKYTQATRNLGAQAKQTSADCDDDEGAKSLSDAVARLDAVPSARAAITSAGMTTREYVVFSFSLLQNGMTAWALSQPGAKLPAGASMANVNFYRAYEAAIQKLGEQTKSGDCDADNSGSEDEQ